MEVVRGLRQIAFDYSLCFDDGHRNGFSFPCDKNGKVIIKQENKAAQENYQWCLEHPEKFERFNYLEKSVHSWREPDYGVCKCGETVYLQNEYMGACKCPKCGQWYNLFGQELLPPDEWGMEYESDDDYVFGEEWA